MTRDSTTSVLNIDTMPNKPRIRDPEVDRYIAALEHSRKEACQRLRDVLLDNLPPGFDEQMASMPSYVVPLDLYPQGYHTKANTPLPFLSFASQKGFIALYHFGLYVDTELIEWFQEEYPRHMDSKLDMGKSCIRFKKPELMPLALIGELAAKRSVSEWIARYERALGR